MRNSFVAVLVVFVSASLAGAQVQTSPPVIVMGNNPHWTRIAGVLKGWTIKVLADGAVKFGPRSSTDTAEAGVEGNSFLVRNRDRALIGRKCMPCLA